jgi:hypothetical protein
MATNMGNRIAFKPSAPRMLALFPWPELPIPDQLTDQLVSIYKLFPKLF